MKADFIQVDDVFINRSVINTNFTCDLEKCHGACCTMESKLGAPLRKNEIRKIEKILPIVEEYLDNRSRNHIKQFGFWKEVDKQFMTASINNRDCVFVFYEGSVAKCAIEKAYFDGKVKFRKPISCHLFPIRISNFGGPVMRFEKYTECESALKNGAKTKINVLNFCKEAVIRSFGKEWFKKLNAFNGSK
ncbi:MAG: DUF3109 family protein [Bacteroidetes bacterium]|nr:DUF3109 family protein [Bacteroidota bacterium]MBU1679715.1 DUF3109 family protein [Bacteroidota bacterium]MBU2506666.1 DUF3109 family protein [Bacteroidota bacterium]